jgi:hypothetical protein
VLKVRVTLALAVLPMFPGAPPPPLNTTLCVTDSNSHVTVPSSAMSTSSGSKALPVVAVTSAWLGNPPPPIATVSA